MDSGNLGGRDAPGGEQRIQVESERRRGWLSHEAKTGRGIAREGRLYEILRTRRRTARLCESNDVVRNLGRVDLVRSRAVALLCARPAADRDPHCRQR